MFRLGVAGSPDIACVMNGRYVGTGVKAPKGKQSEYQKEFQQQIEKGEADTSWRTRSTM